MSDQSKQTASELKDLTTESSNPASAAIDSLSSIEIVRLMNAEDATVAAAVGTQADTIACAIDVIAERIRHGGRLIYLGAGTSGRLGVLDAAECPPTFNTRPEQVIGIIAGGPSALVRSAEGAEDHPESAVSDLDAIQLSANDVVVGIATSGRTPYVIGGLQHAKTLRAATIGLSCNRDSQLAAAAKLMIEPVVGPEVISGSTRMKAGTATKMVLNMLTTGAMVRLGKTYGNLMVDLRASNAKLTDRSWRIVARVTGVSEDQAQELLERCDGEVKTTIVVQMRSLPPGEARRQLDRCDGHLRGALELAPKETSSKLEVSETHQGDLSNPPVPAPPYAKIVVGVDGGGTKTVAWLATIDADDARVVGRATAGPSNPQSVGFAEAFRSIESALSAAFADAKLDQGPVAAMCLAVAGVDRHDDRATLTDWARNQRIAETVIVVNDADAVLAAGTQDGCGIALVCGTGSFCFGRSRKGPTARAGGWGYLLGDEGSGYAIAINALRAAARAGDGRGPQTELLSRLLSHFNLNSAEQLIPYTYKHLASNRTNTAALADIVFESARSSDEVAIEIVEDSAKQLAELVVSVTKKLGIEAEAIPLVMTGGVLCNSLFLQERLLANLQAKSLNVTHKQVVAVPVAGAVSLARAAVLDRVK